MRLYLGSKPHDYATVLYPGNKIYFYCYLYEACKLTLWRRNFLLNFSTPSI